jgi:hypothetical protein
VSGRKSEMKKRTVRFDKLTRAKNQISMTFSVDDLRFETAYWYNDVNLFHLEDKFGREYMNKVYFHIMAFEGNKLVSLNPEMIDLGDYARFHTSEFESLWKKILHKVWAQWRYENHLPYHEAPVFKSSPADISVTPIDNQNGPVEMLCFCGGGKDSLVAMKLLDRTEFQYSSLAYSSSVYGTSQHQHDLISRLLRHGNPHQRHQLWIYDSFIDSPVLKLYPEYRIKHLTAAETPASIFASLPIVLQHGYSHIVLAHERSANVGNLVWKITGEDVNHQWGKSFEAELLINEYLQNKFIKNFSYFSLLQPIYDVIIFNLLRRDASAVVDTHSCNIQKPWCCRCPKCAYVWLNYMAYLPSDLINLIFKTNLFDIDDNQQWFYEMLGLGDHIPFECIGQVAESRLAFELCKKKGLTGKAMDMYMKHFPNLETKSILDKYLNVAPGQSAIPPAVATHIVPQMQKAAKEAHLYIKEIMG